VTQQQTVPPPAQPVLGSRLPWRPIALVVGTLVVVAGGLGALGGWLWYQWWGPPNTGEIYDTTTWGPRWFDLSDQGLAQQFDGPAQYTVVALGLGAVLGVLGAVLGRRQALAALVALTLGSALAAYLSYAVGTALSPPDPQQFATEANLGEEYRAAIEVTGWTPFLCWPIGALGAFALSIPIAHWIQDFRRLRALKQDDGTWLEASARSARSEQSPPPSA
jgi:hypothetical protein